ncbi:MAG: hypothetical protein GY749_30600 [Desulfobacteraceae bacterium]|nr:hypothetical protein [Desulfobacteraceae bacterium]
MKPDVAFKILNDCISNSTLNEFFKNIEFHPVCSKFPNSIVASFENNMAGGEIIVYLNPEQSYCEYEFLISENEKFITEYNEFNSSDDLEENIHRYIKIMIKELSV